jgi:arylsulfatase A-like enzyme
LYRVVALAVCLLFPGALRGAAAPPAPRNIVVIFADDIGYGDLGCYGATLVQTPNLDRLAREGMRFTDAHAQASVCTPTRYSLITGQYAWRYPPGASILSGVAPLSVRPQMWTVPKVLKQAGYVTGVVGKWHLGLGTGQPDYNRPIVPGPREVGFDYSFIIPATGDRVPCVYVEDGRVAGYDPGDPIAVSYKEPIGAEPTGLAHPELLKVKPSQGHNNTIVNGISRIGYMTGGKAARWKDEDMADTITGKAVAFIEKNKDRPFFLHFNTHDIHVPRVPHPRFAGTSRCGTRGDVIQELDWSAGQILGALDRLGLAADTLVFFSSDNGGVMDDGYQDGSGNDSSGHKCNGPLRGYKGGPYEGGNRVPLLARWLGKVPAGTTSAELVCTVDLLATVAALTGQTLPDSDDAGPDSFSFVPALLSERPERPCRDHLVTQSGNFRELAIRQGPWKLIPAAVQAAKKAARGAELYRLDTDLAETNNLASQNPEKVRELAALLDHIRTSGRSRPSGR